MPDKKEASFICINHTASPGIGGGGVHNYAGPDMHSVVVALGRLGEKLDNLRLNVFVEVPEPQIIELAPVIHIPESPITIQQPAIHIPENRPIIEVRPSEVIIQRVDGQIVPAHNKLRIELPWQMWALGTVPTALLILDLLLRFRIFESWP